MKATPSVKTTRAPRKRASIKNVQVQPNGFDNVYWLGCDFDGARYHVWLEPSTLEPVEPVLYKNPPIELKPSDAGYYSTRRLSTRSALGRWITQSMIETMKSNGLLEKARKREEQCQREEQARIKAEALASRKRASAEDLYTLLREYLNRFSGQDAKLDRKTTKVLNVIDADAHD